MGKTKREVHKVENHPVEVKAEGSYVRGFIGALLGALIGAALWCVIMQFGFISGLVGFVIGWLAEKGYTLLKGKVGKGKVVILIVCIVIGVLVGIFASDYIDWYMSIAEYYPDACITIDGQEILVDYSDIPRLIVYYLSVDAEYMGAVVKNVAMGLLFAGLGVFSILRNAGKQAKAAQEAQSVQTGTGPEL